MQNNFIIRFFLGTTKQEEKPEILPIQKLGTLSKLPKESQEILKISVPETTPSSKPTLMDIIESKVSDILQVALPSKEPQKISPAVRDLIGEVIDTLNERALLTSASETFESSSLEIVARCFNFTTKETLAFQKDIVAFNPRWLNENPSIRTFSKITEESYNISTRNFSSWLAIWAEGRGAYYKPGVVTCINDSLTKSNPEACLRSNVSFDLNRIQSLTDSAIEDLRKVYPEEAEDISLLRHVLINHPKVSDALIETENLFVQYINDNVELWIAKNPGKSLEIAAKNGDSIVNSQNFVELLLDKSPISHDNTILRSVTDGVREWDPEYIISWPRVFGPESDLDKDTKSAAKESAGAIPGNTEKAAGKAMAEIANQPAFKIAGMYFFYVVALNFPDLLMLAFLLWYLKYMDKDPYIENSPGGGGNDGNDGNNGNGGKGGG